MKSIVLVFLLLIISSCSGDKVHLTELEWMLGTWETDALEKQMVEEWKRRDDSTFIGSTYLINDKDTILSESMQMCYSAGHVWFRTNVANQNDGQEISFKLTELKGDEAHFRNDEHDFPQQVVYTSPKKDFMWAYIDGNMDGSYQRIDFKFNKSK